MNRMIKKVWLLLLLFSVAVVSLQAQDTRRMYFGLSIEPAWAALLPGKPLVADMPRIEAGTTRFGININLQSFKYIKQWLGFYFGLSLLNNGGRIVAFDDDDPNSPPESSEITCRFQYIAVPFGIALTTPLKRNLQFNLQLGVVMAVNIDETAKLFDYVDNRDIVQPFVPIYQATLSMQYHIGQDVYLHIGPSYMRSMRTVTQEIEMTQQSIGVRAGIIF
jgi:hypothetical protein